MLAWLRPDAPFPPLSAALAEPNGLLYLRVADIAPVATEFGIEVQDSGARHEVGLVDPDGNRIRVGAPTGRSEPGYTYPDPAR